MGLCIDGGGGEEAMANAGEWVEGAVTRGGGGKTSSEMVCAVANSSLGLSRLPVSFPTGVAGERGAGMGVLLRPS